MNVELIQFFTIILFVIGILQYLNKSDEFVLLLVVFFYLTGIARYNAVISGKANWVDVAYAREIFFLTDDLAIEALGYFFMGTAVLSISYLLLNLHKPKYKLIDDNKILREFLKSKQKLIIWLYIFFLIVNGYSNRVMGSVHYSQQSVGVGYFFLFKLAIGGLILLFFMLFKNLPKNKRFLRFVYLVAMILAASSTYNMTSRFQFLSWMIALIFIIVGRSNIITKSIFYAAGGIVVLILFLIAGNKRTMMFANLTTEQEIEYAKERFAMAEDQNMLDGFMMVMQAYPEYLDFGYGSEHFEILLRPIPRAIWPDKPVGGYANKLGLNEGLPGTVGISQSIYGTFYGEGGPIAIVIFCIIYAFIFTKLFNTTLKYGSDMRHLLHGIIFASAVPILRGGDLPGIVAFIGMSYWPVFIFLYLYKKHLKHLARKEKIKETNEKSKQPTINAKLDNMPTQYALNQPHYPDAIQQK